MINLLKKQIQNLKNVNQVLQENRIFQIKIILLSSQDKYGHFTYQKIKYWINNWKILNQMFL